MGATPAAAGVDRILLACVPLPPKSAPLLPRCSLAPGRSKERASRFAFLSRCLRLQTRPPPPAAKVTRTCDLPGRAEQRRASCVRPLDADLVSPPRELRRSRQPAGARSSQAGTIRRRCCTGERRGSLLQAGRQASHIGKADTKHCFPAYDAKHMLIHERGSPSVRSDGSYKSQKTVSEETSQGRQERRLPDASHGAYLLLHALDDVPILHVESLRRRSRVDVLAVEPANKQAQSHMVTGDIAEHSEAGASAAAALAAWRT